LSVNKVILIGNLGADPEVRELDGNREVANLRLATNETYTNKNGEKITHTEWHRLEIWGKLAGIARQYLKKGSQIYVEGSIRTDNWQDQEGNQRYTTKIRVDRFDMLGGPPQNGNQGQPPPPDSSTDDDLPF